MATFEELFPHIEQPAFEPIEVGRVRQALPAIRKDAVEEAADDPFLDVFGALKPPTSTAPEGEVSAGDYGRAVVAGAGDTASMLGGALEYFGRQAKSPLFQEPGQALREAGQEFATDWTASMSPEARTRIEREILTLDPNRTIWQGGPGEFMSSVGLKLARTAPSTAVTLLPGALIMRAGLRGGIAYLGASEGALSLGGIANGITQEIEEAPEAELLQSEKYQELRKTMDEPQARQALIAQAQGMAPLFGGVIVGLISSAAGRYLEPVFVDGGAGISARFGRGFVSEAGQESLQSGAEQTAQNIAAQIFDADRGAFEGVPEQMAQGALIGGAMGGSVAAAIPRRRQALPVAEDVPALGTTPAPDPFEEVFGVAQQRTPTLDEIMPPVDPALAAAMAARRDGLISDMFEQPQEPAAPPGVMREGPAGQMDMREVWARNEQMDLPQAPPRPEGIDTVVPVPGQQNLPLQERVRGRGRVPVVATPAAPLQEDTSVPPEFSMERQLPPDLMPAGRRPTRADFLRARNEQLRAERYRGTVRDESQQDLFVPPAATPPGAPPGPARLRTPQAAGFAVQVLDDSGGLVEEETHPTAEEANARADEIHQMLPEAIVRVRQKSTAQPQAAAFMQTPDVPSAEPLGDLQAQLEELSDPDSERRGVYLSPDNIKQLRQAGTFEQVRGVGVPMPNFDSKGGTLIAKNRAVANELLAMRDQGAGDMQAVLGFATGAGGGKQAGANIAVQQRDEQGNVVRESLVATPEEAEALASQFDQPGRTGVILSAGQALKRRAQRIREESRQAVQTRETKKESRRASDIIEKELDEDLGPRARKKLGSKPLTEQESARRLVGYSSRLRKRELAKRIGEIDAPETLSFEDAKAAQEYQRLFNEYLGAQTLVNTAKTAEDTLKAKARRESLRRQIGALRRLKRASTESERVARVARMVSEEEVQKIEREARDTATTRVDTEGDILEGSVREQLESVTEEQLKGMTGTEVDLLFTKAAQVMAGFRKAKSTFEELVTAHPSRSERVKLIGRAQRALRLRALGGRAKTKPITGLTKDRKVVGGKGTYPIRQTKSVLNPTQALIDDQPPREQSKEDRVKYNKRVRETYAALEKSLTKVRPMFTSLARQSEEDVTSFARAYVRVLYRYGNLLLRLHSRSPAGLKAAEKFNSIVADLAATPKAKLLSKLSKMMQAEIDVQAREASRVDPKNLGFLSSRKKRLLATKESVDKLRQRIARAQLVEEKWKTNAFYNKFVSPVLQKMVGYMVRDQAPFADIVVSPVPGTGRLEVQTDSGRRGLREAPTLEEMQGLQFALKRFRMGAETREDLFKPLKRWLTELGFQFDGQELVIPMKDGRFEWSNEAQLLRAAKDRRAYAPVLTPEQRAADERRAAERRAAATAELTEWKRRAALSPKMRAWEDRRAAQKKERARRKDLTPEARRLLESMDARDKYNLDLSEAFYEPGVDKAVQATAAIFEEAGISSLTDVLKTLSANMPADSRFQPLLRHLISLNMADAIVGWDRSGKFIEGLGQYRDDGKRRMVIINRKRLENMRARGEDPAGAFLHALLHESVHAASVTEISTNPRIAALLTNLMDETITLALRQGIDLGDVLPYGLRKNIKEFVAEAFSSGQFQSILRQIKVGERTLWQKFVDVIRSILGLSKIPRMNNMLEVVLSTSESVLTGRKRTAGAELTEQLNLDAPTRQTIGNIYDKALQSNRVVKDVHSRAAKALEANKEGGTRFLLSAITMRQIKEFYERSFSDGSEHPLTDYMRAFFARNADNAANMEPAILLSRQWTEFTEKHGAEAAAKLSRVMARSTLYGIHSDKGYNHSSNDHLASKGQEKRHAELAAEYAALDPQARKLYHDVKEFYSSSLQREVNLMTLNALRSYLTKGADAPLSDAQFSKYMEADIEAKKLNTIEGMEKEFGDKLSEPARSTIYQLAKIPSMHKGPYFPLTRFGDYVVTASKDSEAQTFADRKAANTYAESRRRDDPTLSVSSPIEVDSGFEIRVTEKEVRIAESPSEAEALRQELISLYGVENVSQVQLKADLYRREATISSGSALGTILNKLQDNPAAQAAIKDFYLRSLADGSFRKHEARRSNRRGVNYDLQHRTFANYAKAAGYYTAQLRYGWQMSDALIRMQKYVEDTASGKHESSLSPIRMGEVVREIRSRDEMSVDPTKVSKLVRKSTMLTQFMMLTSPSYWMINATQPWMVSLPWMAARSSFAEASSAIAGAQALVAHPLVAQARESWAGIKALGSKVAAEKAFSVLDQVESWIKQRAGDRADEYINLLNELKRESVIDLTMQTELRDIAEGQDSGLSQRVLDASRVMAHLTEVNNRIITAIAAYDLSRNKGNTPETAREFAKQAVTLTQFDYSSGNAPRLFQSGVGRLVFQFMKYPQHMYALLIDNFRKAVQTGGMEKKHAIKTLAGLFATHLAAGGIVGAMLQPIKWAIGLTLAAFGDDDEPYSVSNALSGETFDRLIREAAAELFGTDLGEVLSAGLPRGVGIDVSNRMSLGTLYFLDLKTDTAESTLGSLAAGVGGPSLSLLMGGFKGLGYLSEGELTKGAEFFLPKVGKDISKFLRFANEGVTTTQGSAIVGADQLSPWDLFLQSTGLQPARVANAYARSAAIKERKTFDDDRREELIRRFRRANPGERNDILSEIREFSQSNPAAAITRSQLIRSLVANRMNEARAQRFGAALTGADRLYMEEGEPYEE